VFDLLEVTLAPRLVEPVTGIRRSLAELVGNSLVVVTSGFQEGVASPRGRVGDSMTVKEALELTLSPSVCNKEDNQSV